MSGYLPDFKYLGDQQSIGCSEEGGVGEDETVAKDMSRKQVKDIITKNPSGFY